MIKIINCSNKNYINNLRSLLKLRRAEKNSNMKIVSKIIRDIKKNKLKALLKYEKKFSKNKEIKLSNDRINKSIKNLDPKVKRAIDYAYSRILKFHAKQIKELKNIIYIDKFKNKIEYRYSPIESVGVYVPGNLPSTLLMTSIPAKLAKVKKIILATPKINGKLNSAVLYAAKKIGVKEIYSMGGVQAIASLAYIQKVNKVVGPGNKFVAEAKRQLSGKVIGTETMYAGASEICILADKNTNINQVITSLVSQAEHDPDSQCILVTKDKKMINRVNKGIVKSLKTLPRKKIAISSIKKNGLIVKTNSDKQIIDVINEIAPEHLELNVKNYSKYSRKIFNAGSICNGKYTPMSVSDYTVGTNHVLPTSGAAKFSSGLGVIDFMKKSSLVEINEASFDNLSKHVQNIADVENLDAHKLSVKIRQTKQN